MAEASPGDSSGRVTLIEMFCAGTEGSTLGYRRDGARVSPVLVSPTNASALAWGLAEVRWVVRAVVQELLTDDVEAVKRPCDLRGVVDLLLRLFWEQPTSAEIETWGSFPFEADDTHRKSTPLAAPVSWASIAAELRLGRVTVRPASSWRAGTAGVSQPPWRQLLNGMALVERHRLDLRRVPRRWRGALVSRQQR